MTDVCREFGISGKTGYNIFNRYREHGGEAFSDRSRQPVRYANQLPQQVESLIVTLRACPCSHPCAMGTETSFEYYLLKHSRKTGAGRLYKQEHNYCYKKARALRRCYTRCYTSYRMGMG